MTTESALLATECPGLELVARGKVRDVYAVPGSPDALLFVATDRLSAYDVVMRTGVPGKGRVLTQLSLHWFQAVLPAVLPPGGHHVLTGRLEEMPPAVQAHAEPLRGRCMLVRRLRILPVEAIVRGYVAGGPLLVSFHVSFLVAHHPDCLPPTLNLQQRTRGMQ